MARGRKIVKVIEVEECTLKTAEKEFYRHNEVKGLAKATQRTYQIYVGCFVEWCGKDKLLSDITTKTIDDYMCKKADDGNKPVSIASNITHIRRFFNFCASRGYMTKLDITIPKYEVELKEPYTDEEMKLLLRRPRTNSWVEYRNWAMVNYFYATGQRLSTVINIKVKHVDLDNAQVKLIWNKDKIQKWMPLSSAIVKVLREYIFISELEEEDYLFPEYEGGPLHKRSVESALENYNHSRGVQKTGIHLFRHTFAKNYIINGGNAVKLQKLMNHKSLEQTMKYVNLYNKDISADLDLFNPLDTFKRKHYAPMKRRTVIGVN